MTADQKRPSRPSPIYALSIVEHQLPEAFQGPAAFAGALGTKRNLAPAADTSRALLMTILGEFVLPTGGTAWTQTIIDGLQLVGVREKAARQTVARMHEQGWLNRTRLGRQTRWSLTPATEALLRLGAERIYSFGQADRPWDGQWLVLLASVPEADRGARYRMNVGLRWAGFGTIGHGTWLCPWIEQEDAALEVLKDLEVEATSFVAHLSQLGDGETLAAQAWDLPTLRSQYDDFLTETESLLNPGPGPGPDEAEAARHLTLLVHRWRQFPFLDPDLPAELLPADWPGPSAAARFGELRQRLLAPATRHWETAERGHTPGQ